MNKLLIPPSPNWYETDIMACAPDNTVIYGSRQDIVVIKSTPENEPDDVQIITKAHSMRIKSINVNKNWGQPHKYAVTVSEDKIVKLWDIESLEKKLSHNKHILQDDETKIVGASFAGDDRIISTSESGIVIIWNITKNETNILRSLFETKAVITCLSVCPHATWLAAFGLKSGLIIVTDLRRTGQILYKLRGHDKAVVSLSWCPAPVNIFPVKPNNKVVEKSLEEVNEFVKIEDFSHAGKKVDNKGEKIDYKDKHDSDTIEKESINHFSEITSTKKIDGRKQKYPKKNPWVGLVHADDDLKEVPNKHTEESDFLKECANLRNDILQMSTPKSENEVEKLSTAQEFKSASNIPVRAILKPRTKGKNSKLPDLLLKKELASETESLQKELVKTGTSDIETVDTPTDRSEVSMEISKSVEKLAGKLTDRDEKSMEITRCGRTYSTNTVEDTHVSEVDKKDVSTVEVENNKESSFDALKLNSTTSSEEGKGFSSVSSCDNDCNCKKHTEMTGKEKKADTSSTSEGGEVFHDAELCEKIDKDRVICRTEDPVHFEEQPRKEFLLASSARDPNIYIWRAGTDGRMQTFMTVPFVKNKKKSSRSEKIWITLCWVTPHILLSSSRSAELLQWTLPKPMTQAKFVRQVHRDHWSVLFTIKAPILYPNEFNFLQKRNVNVWTTGMERTILNTDIESQKNLGFYHALGGSVNCFSGSPLDPNRLAFGTGEGVLNVWDLSRDHKKRIIFSTFYQKIGASVTALAWHPLLETSLAFATMEGRIGILDIVGKAKSPKLLPNYFKNQIFKMEWGPLNGDLQDRGLYVVGEAKVAIFDPKSQEKEPALLEMPDNTSVYTMSWKPDYSALLISSKSGSLITYTPDLKILNVSYLSHKLQSIVWNPNAAIDDLSLTKYCRTFASVVKHNEIIVYDLGADWVLNDDNVIVQFKNRGVLINSIEWNPHLGNQLVSVDDGGIAQVYDIESKTLLATYVNRCLDALLSAYWSPVDQDYIITGTVGHRIIVWKVSENAPLTDQEINSARSKITKAQSKEMSDQLVKTKLDKLLLPSTDDIDISKLKKPVKSSVLPLFYAMKDKAKAQDLKKLLQWKLDDQAVESNIGDNRNVDVLEIFDEKNNMDRVLELNISSFRQKGQHQNANLLTLFQGDISTVVKQAIEEKRVTPWIISMCPMVNPNLWRKACETYANQLQDEADADPLEIVTYLLACHKVDESVNVLCEKGLFREALVLAKARFGTGNSIVPDVLDKWAKNLVYQGNLEMGAQCYISIGKFEEAATALFRRSNAEILEVAVELAKLSKNEELHRAVQFRFNAFKTDGDEAKEASKLDDHSHKEIGQDCCQVSSQLCPCKDNVQKEKINDEKESLIKDNKSYLEGEKILITKIRELIRGSENELEAVNENTMLLVDAKTTEKSPKKKADNDDPEETEHKKFEHTNVDKLNFSIKDTKEIPKQLEDGTKNSSEAKSTSESKDLNKKDMEDFNKLEDITDNKIKHSNDKEVLNEESVSKLKGSEKWYESPEALIEQLNELDNEKKCVSGLINKDDDNVKELTNSFQEEATKLEEGVRKVLESQDELLFSEEIRELLGERKDSLKRKQGRDKEE